MNTQDIKIDNLAGNNQVIDNQVFDHADVKASSLKKLSIALFFVGASFVFISGFANSAVMHNAAHDTRHALSFPCH